MLHQLRHRTYLARLPLLALTLGGLLLLLGARPAAPPCRRPY